MKIALVCNEYPPQPKLGGIGVFTHTLAHGLLREGHTVTVVGVGSGASERNDDGVRVVTLRQSRTRGIAWLLTRRRLFKWLQESVRRGEIDLIEVPDFGAMLIFPVAGCPVVVRLHLTNTIIRRQTHQNYRALRCLERRGLALHHNWIGPSGFILRETEHEFGVTPSDSTIIYNPVHAAEESQLLPELPHEYVLYAGTVCDHKGAFVLAEAARSFLTAFPRCHLGYAGNLTGEDGLPADERIRRIVGRHLVDRVHCLGFLEHATVVACMRRARLLAFPSKLESFGLVAAEAMCCGTPVVYSTAGAGPEVVDDGVTGLLADPWDSRDVAEKVLRLLNDPGLADTLAENGKRVARQRFSLDRCLGETVAFYGKCLQSGNSDT